MKKISFYVIFILCIFVFNSCDKESSSPSQETETTTESEVLQIFDGDSFRWRNTEDQVIEIRLYGIDAPEYEQPYGETAKAALVNLIANKTITIQKKDTDSYGRTIAIASVGDTVINEFMLQNGHVWHYKYFDSTKKWSDLEQTARDSMWGLWSDPDPIEPWEWRRTH